ncbi:MAG: hypothetical protein R3F60_17465 [bacterium]
MPRTLPLVTVLFAAVGLFGCDKRPQLAVPGSKKLKTPERTAAIAKLGEMKAKEAIGPLMEAYKEGVTSTRSSRP